MNPLPNECCGNFGHLDTCPLTAAVERLAQRALDAEQGRDRAVAEEMRLRAMLDEVRGIVGTAIEVPERLRPAVIWDLADWHRRTTSARRDEP